MKGAARLVRASDWARQSERLGSSERATGLVFIKSKSSSAFVEGRARQ